MNREEFRSLSDVRLREAKALLDAGLFHGAYYLAGYAIECALKACICKQTRADDFPDKDRANRAWVHDLERLVGVAGLSKALQDEIDRSPGFGRNWATVKDWSEETRYNVDVPAKTASAFYEACTEESNGLLSWVRERW